MTDFQVKKSGIPNAGMGLFALREFKGPKQNKTSKIPGETIIEYKGEIICAEKDPFPAKSMYKLQVNKNWWIDANDIKKSNLARYANTCTKEDIKSGFCKGNNATISISYPKNAKRPIANLKAVKKINPGDEIFVAYGTSFKIVPK